MIEKYEKIKDTAIAKRSETTKNIKRAIRSRGGRIDLIIMPEIFNTAGWKRTIGAVTLKAEKGNGFTLEKFTALVTTAMSYGPDQLFNSMKKKMTCEPTTVTSGELTDRQLKEIEDRVTVSEEKEKQLARLSEKTRGRESTDLYPNPNGWEGKMLTIRKDPEGTLILDQCCPRGEEPTAMNVVSARLEDLPTDYIKALNDEIKREETISELFEEMTRKCYGERIADQGEGLKQLPEGQENEKITELRGVIEPPVKLTDGTRCSVFRPCNSSPDWWNSVIDDIDLTPARHDDKIFLSRLDGEELKSFRNQFQTCSVRAADPQETKRTRRKNRPAL